MTPNAARPLDAKQGALKPTQKTPRCVPSVPSGTPAPQRPGAVRPNLGTRARKRAGRCYELAYHFVVENPDAHLVHGEIQGHGHAWVVYHGWVWDPSDNRLTAPTEWRWRAHARPIVTLTQREAAEALCSEGHYGPFHGEDLIHNDGVLP